MRGCLHKLADYYLLRGSTRDRGFSISDHHHARAGKAQDHSCHCPRPFSYRKDASSAMSLTSVHRWRQCLDMETENRGGGRPDSHGPRPKQSIDQDGLPIPGSYSVASQTKTRCSGAIVRYLTHHVSQDMYQFQGFRSPMIELRSRPRAKASNPHGLIAKLAGNLGAGGFRHS